MFISKKHYEKLIERVEMLEREVAHIQHRLDNVTTWKNGVAPLQQTILKLEMYVMDSVRMVDKNVDKLANKFDDHLTKKDV